MYKKHLTHVNHLLFNSLIGSRRATNQGDTHMDTQTLNAVLNELRSQLYYYERADIEQETDFTMGRVVAMQQSIENLTYLLKDIEAA